VDVTRRYWNPCLVGMSFAECRERPVPKTKTEAVRFV
jgi:hypothetical protein